MRSAVNLEAAPWSACAVRRYPNYLPLPPGVAHQSLLQINWKAVVYCPLRNEACMAALALRDSCPSLHTVVRPNASQS